MVAASVVFVENEVHASLPLKAHSATAHWRPFLHIYEWSGISSSLVGVDL